ncbi:MAG: AAA family ATPase [Candidatus Omnitrophota bacterium]
MNENAVLGDAAFYDRFVRKTVPAGTQEDLVRAIQKRQPLFFFKKSISLYFADLKKRFNDKGLECSSMDILRVTDYAAGRLNIDMGELASRLSEYIKIDLQGLLSVAVEETLLYFRAYAKNSEEEAQYETCIRKAAGDVGRDPLKEQNFIEYSKDTKELIFDKIGLAINERIAQKIEDALQKRKWPKEPEKQENIIKTVLIDELDLVVTKEEKKILSSIARNHKFGNGVIRLEGVTGGGKTYSAEALSKLMRFTSKKQESRHFYAEPVEVSTKLSKFIGTFKTDEYGYYSLDQQTHLLNILQNGGVTAVSELNTAVKDDYAKLGWWFIQFARGDEDIYLTEYPGNGEGVELSSRIKRSKESIMIIDINPEDYEARGRLPEDLVSFSPRVHVRKPEQAEIQKIAKSFLRHVKNAEARRITAKFFSNAHFLVQEKIDEVNRVEKYHAPLSFRELRRVAMAISTDDDKHTAMEKAKKAVNKYYISAFKDPKIRKEFRDDWKIAVQDIKDMVNEIVFKDSSSRAPPTLVFSSAKEKPFKELDSIIEDRRRNNEDIYCEKVLLSYYTDSFKLFGGYMPVSEEVSIEWAKNFLIQYISKDAQNKKNAAKIYNEITGKRFPAEISKLLPNEILSLSTSLDALRNNQDWRPKLKYERGIIPRIIHEAKQDKNEEKLHIIAFENFHRIRPGLAVALNTILQEGYYYAPILNKEVSVPSNVRFFATAISETSLPISMAEQSRWVRIYRGYQEQSSEEIDNELETVIFDEIRKNVEVILSGQRGEKERQKLEEILAVFKSETDPVREWGKSIKKVIRDVIDCEFVENKHEKDLSFIKNAVRSIVWSVASGYEQEVLADVIDSIKNWIYGTNQQSFMEIKIKQKINEILEQRDLNRKLNKREQAPDEDGGDFYDHIMLLEKVKRSAREIFEEFPGFEYIFFLEKIVAKLFELPKDTFLEEKVRWFDANIEKIKNLILKKAEYGESIDTYFEENLSKDTAAKKGTNLDNLLEEIDELIEVESATYKAFQEDKIVVYEGAPGGGKTDMAIDVARRMGLDHFVYSCHGKVHSADLLGGFMQNENGTFSHTSMTDAEGNYPFCKFLQMLTYGGVFIFDEGAIGRRSQELISLLSTLARGEKIFIMNEVPGQPAQGLKVHKDFYVIITMNPANETPGREALPLEVYEKAKKIWISNKLKQESYRAVIKRFTEKACKKYGIEINGIFKGDVFPDEFADLICAVQDEIYKAVGTQISLNENQNLHLVTLRDMKLTVNIFVEYIAKGMAVSEALQLALRVVYVAQFEKNKDRGYIFSQIKKMLFLDTGRYLVEFLKKNDIRLNEFIKNFSQDLNEGILDQTLQDADMSGGFDKTIQEPGKREELQGLLPKGISVDALDKETSFAEPKKLKDGKITVEEAVKGQKGIYLQMASIDRQWPWEKMKEMDLYEDFLKDDPRDRFPKICSKKLTEDDLACKQKILNVGKISNLPLDAQTRAENGEIFMYEQSLEDELKALGIYKHEALDEFYQVFESGMEIFKRIDKIHINGKDFLVTSCGDETIKIWDFSKNKRIVRTIMGCTGALDYMKVLNVKGKDYIFLGKDDNGFVKLMDLTLNDEKVIGARLDLPQVKSADIMTIDGESYIAIACGGKHVRLWGVFNNSSIIIKGLEKEIISVLRMKVNGKDHLITMEGKHGYVELWDLSPNEEKMKPFNKIKVGGVQYIVTTDRNNSIKVQWAEADGRVGIIEDGIVAHRPMVVVRNGEECLAIATEMLALGHNKLRTDIQIWDISHPEILRVEFLMGGHSSMVTDVCKMSLGEKGVVVSGGMDGNINFWDISEPGKECCKSIKIKDEKYLDIVPLTVDDHNFLIASSMNKNFIFLDMALEEKLKAGREIRDVWQQEQIDEAKLKKQEKRSLEDLLPPGISLEDIKNKKLAFAEERKVLDRNLTEKERNEGYVNSWKCDFEEIERMDYGDLDGEAFDVDIDGGVVLTGEKAPVRKHICLLTEKEGFSTAELDLMAETKKKEIANGEVFVYTQKLNISDDIGYKLVDNAETEDEMREFYKAIVIKEGSMPISLGKITIEGKELLVSGHTDGSVKIWDITADTVKILYGHLSGVEYLSQVKIKGKDCLVSADNSRNIKIWNFAEDQVISLKTEGDVIALKSLWRKGTEYVVSASNEAIEVWDISESENETEIVIRPDKGKITTMAVLDGGIAFADDKKWVRFLDIKEGCFNKTKLVNEISELVTVKINKKEHLAMWDSKNTLSICCWRKKGEVMLFGNIAKGSYSNFGVKENVDGTEHLIIGSDLSGIKILNVEGKTIKELPLKGPLINSLGGLPVIEINGRKHLVCLCKESLRSKGTTITFWDLEKEGAIKKAIEDLEALELLELKHVRDKKKEHEMPLETDVLKGKVAPQDLPEQDSIVESRYALRAGGRVLLIMQPGAREQVVLNETARRENIQDTASIEGSPALTVYDMFGGLAPVLKGEKRQDKKKIVYKKGFFTRHMLNEAEKKQYDEEVRLGKKHEPVLLVIHNIDSIPEKVRAAVNNLLLNGYIEVPQEGRYYLPDHVKIMATIHSRSQQNFSSAFPNRFIKVNVNAMETRHFGVSEFCRYCIGAYDLNKDVARQIEWLYCMIKNLESKGFVWPSGNVYDFTVKDALTHAKFVSLAVEERRRSRLSLENEDISQIFIREAMRSYGARLRQYKIDRHEFVESVLKLLFKEDLDIHEVIASDITLLDGKLDSLSNIPIMPSKEGLHPYNVDKTYRLTLVRSIVKTLSDIIRGFQAGKIVSLAGETGVAKTTMGVVIAKLLGLKYYIFSTHKEAKAYDITAGIKASDDGSYKLELSEFAEKLKKGNTVLIVDEANLKPEILWILSGIARGEKQFTIEVPGDDPLRFEIGENIYVMFTMNPERYGGDRGLVPLPLKEDAFNVWTPAEYEDNELFAIVNEFFDGLSILDNVKTVTKQESISRGMDIEGRLFGLRQYLRYEYSKILIDNLLDAIDEKGHKSGLMSFMTSLKDQETADKGLEELRELEKEILEREEVQERIRRIRTIVGSLCPDVKIVFSLFKWWSASPDGKIINVPLYELVYREKNPEKSRSNEAIIGLILHEIGHKFFTPDHEEYKEIIASMDRLDLEEHQFLLTLTGDKDSQDADFFRLWNTTEDVRIDHMKDPRLPGAEKYINAMNKEFFLSWITEDQKRKEIFLKAIETKPSALFKGELLCYGYNGSFSAYFKYLPEELREDLQKVAEIDNNPFHRATISDLVKIDFNKLNNDEDFIEEKKQKAGKSAYLLIKEINPLFQKWVERDIKVKDEDDIFGNLPNFACVPPEMLEDNGSDGKGSSSQNVIVSEGGDVVNVGEGEKKQSKSSSSNGKGKGGLASRMETFERAEKAIQKRCGERLQGEPFNKRLAEVGPLGKRLAEGFINIFRVPEEPEIEESPFGRIINIIRFIIGSDAPFDVEFESQGKTDVALGITVDASTSMKSFFEALRRLSAILLSSFQQIGDKGELSITVDTKMPETIKDFIEKFSQDELNGAQKNIEDKIDEGGDGIHLYDCIMEIIKKYKNCNKQNKIEIIFTDGYDSGSLISKGKYQKDLWESKKELNCSERLDKAFQQAEKMGIELVGIGFNTKGTEVFPSFVQLDADEPDAIVGILLSLARIKVQTGKCPKGDLTELFDFKQGGVIARDTMKRRPVKTIKRYTIAKSAALPKKNINKDNGKQILSGGSLDQDIKKEDFGVQEMVEASQQVLPEIWKNTAQDIIILPQTEIYKSQEESIRRQIRKIDKKYEQTTSTFAYTFDDQWQEHLIAELEKAAREFLEKLRLLEDKARLLLYVPDTVNDVMLEKILEKAGIDKEIGERITIIREQGFCKEIPIDVVMHVILGKVLLNYERYRKNDYSAEMTAGEQTKLIEFVKTITDPDVTINLKLLNEMLDGKIFFKARKMDFQSIKLWKKTQAYILRSA